MEIDRLAENLDVNSKILIDIIALHGDKLEKEGLNLQIEGDYVVKF